MRTTDQDRSNHTDIRVKFLARGIEPGGSAAHYTRQLPVNKPVWGNCRFVFDIDTLDYDWLVVYHDLFRRPWSFSEERLRCPHDKTILVTTEPSSITVYGTDYLRQYGVVITSQEPWAVSHPNPIFTQCGLIWFYGFPFADGPIRTYDDIRAMPPPVKSKSIATVCSDRKGRLTLHSRRFDFTRRLRAALPELDVFGHGVTPMSDKSVAIDPYNYHISIENHVFPHHLTEKMPDAFLGYAVPFYHGCPNAADYFPAESFIPIDISDFPKSLDIIRSTLANNEYKDRLPYVIEARRRVLEEYNLFAVLAREIGRLDTKPLCSRNKGVIMNRQTLRIKRPLTGLRSLAEKVLFKARHSFGWV
jgi:hypothetical protein